MKQLSHKERDYRCKIIAENHLKKDTQRYIDFYVAENKLYQISLTYKYLYFNYGLLHSILVKYNLSKLNYAMKGIGTSCAKVANSLTIFATSLRSLGDYEKTKFIEKDNKYE